MREVKLPDGKIAQFPKDTPDEVLHSFAKDYIDNNLNNQAEAQPEIQQQSPISRGEALLETATNIPFAPRIKAGLAAGTAKLAGVKEPISDLYNEALQDKLIKLGQARERYPAQSLASEVASGLALPATKGLAGAIGMGAAQAIGETNDLTDVGDVASKGIGASLLSAGTYGVLKGAGKIYKKYIGAPKVQKMTADQVRQLASKAYQEADKKGGIVSGNFVGNLIDEAHKFDKQTAIGKAIAGETPISKVKTILEPFRGQPLSLQSLQEIDEALADKIDSFVENGRITKEGLPLLKLQNSLRNSIENLHPSMVEGGKEGFEALKKGRALWAKSAKLRDIERIITRAEMSDNPATAIKSGFRTLFNNENKLKYFNIYEKDLIKKAAKSGFVSDSLQTMGSRLVPIGAIIAGGGLPSTMAGMASSTASRSLASKAQLAKAEKIAEAIIAGKAPMPQNPNSILSSVIAQKLGARTVYQQPQLQE